MLATPKVLHLIGQLVRGGAERQLISIAEALMARGWPQMIVSFSAGDAWDSLAQAKGIPLRRVRPHANKLLRLAQLYRLVWRERPAIVHSWSRHINVYAAGLRLPYPRLKLILSFRGNPLVNSRTGVGYKSVLGSPLYHWADLVLSNSQAALDQAVASGLVMRRCQRVDNLIIAEGRATPGEAVAVPHIVAVGALNPLKSYDVLLHALSQVAWTGGAFTLSLAGDGPERARLENLADSLGIGALVHFMGEIDDVPDLLAQAHLMVHPSLSEGLSNAILEAMAEGLPVIATNADGNREIVQHEANGLLVPVNQPDALADAIRRLLGDPALRLRLGQNGLANIKARFGAERVVAHYEDIYHSLIEQ
jgi:glycosyltransferase involved in cell wall biosynthesis